MHTEKKPIIVLTMSRSGSNYLLELIQSTGEFIKFGEIFRDSGDSHTELELFLGQPADGPGVSVGSKKSELLARLLEASESKQQPFVAKLFYYHVGVEDDLWSSLAKVRVLHLVRLNSLAVYVSRMLAQQSGIWKSHQATSSYDAGKVRIDRDEFIQWKRWRDSLIERARERLVGLDSLEIYYEDLTNAARAKAEVMRAVGFEPRLEQVRVKRQRSKSLCDIVANYHEIEDFDLSRSSDRG